MTDFSSLTDEAALAALGDRLAEYRLGMNLTQQELAREAGVHENTIVRLEGGGSTQAKNLLRVLRVLGLIDNLDQLVPPPTPSPLQQLESREKKRRRASSRRPSSSREAAEWSWDDDADAGDDDSGGAEA